MVHSLEGTLLWLKLGVTHPITILPPSLFVGLGCKLGCCVLSAETAMSSACTELLECHWQVCSLSMVMFQYIRAGRHRLDDSWLF